MRRRHAMTSSGPVLRTRQVAGISELVECLRHISSDVVMHFTPEGLQICELTATNALYIAVLLQIDRFESYQGTGSVRVGCLPLHGALKAITRQVARQGGTGHDGMLEMRVGVHSLSLSLTCVDNTGDSPDMLYELPAEVLDPAVADEMVASAAARRELLMRPENFGSIMYMNARHLTHLVSHVLPLGDVVKVACCGNRVDFAVINRHSDITSVRVSFREALGSGGRAAGDAGHSMDGHCSVFRQPLFTMLLRAMSQHTTSTLLLPRAPRNPAMMQASVSDLGSMSIAIAQIDDPGGSP